MRVRFPTALAAIFLHCSVALAKGGAEKSLIHHGPWLTWSPLYYVAVGVVFGGLALFTLKHEAKEFLSFVFGIVSIGSFVAAGVTVGLGLGVGTAHTSGSFVAPKPHVATQNLGATCRLSRDCLGQTVCASVGGSSVCRARCDGKGGCSADSSCVQSSDGTSVCVP